MTPIIEPEQIELPRGVVAESSAPLPIIQFPDIVMHAAKLVKSRLS